MARIPAYRNPRVRLRTGRSAGAAAGPDDAPPVSEDPRLDRACPACRAPAGSPCRPIRADIPWSGVPHRARELGSTSDRDFTQPR